MNSNPISSPSHSTQNNFSNLTDATVDGNPWNEINVLTLDGGGVRGYYSLLHLQELMRHIEEEEKERDGLVISSFHPFNEPQHVSHHQRQDNFLPCHYFDYIGGTSTGGIITIMLARLRMPVYDCLKEYESLGGLIFGKPRWPNAISLPILSNRNMFDTAHLEDAIKDVLQRRGEIPVDSDEAMLFRIEKGLCRAIVLAVRNTMTKSRSSKKKPEVGLETTMILRSYDNLTNAGRRSKATLSKEHQGYGTKLAAWKVARAATAAPFYFKPLKIDLMDGEVILPRRRRTIRAEARRQTHKSKVAELSDAGANSENNPSIVVLEEVKTIIKPRQQAIGTWVSVGAARPNKDPSSRFKLIAFLKKQIYQSGDPEKNHKTMDAKFRGSGKYFRLNEPDGLNGDNLVDLADWQPFETGATTLNRMRGAFTKWSAENQDYFRDCAKRLVDCRRRRALPEPNVESSEGTSSESEPPSQSTVNQGPADRDPLQQNQLPWKHDQSLWERYSCGTFYTCERPNCRHNCDEVWHYRDDFLQHLKGDHGVETLQQEYQQLLGSQRHTWQYKRSTSPRQPQQAQSQG